jgi:hypothetical protein
MSVEKQIFEDERLLDPQIIKRLFDPKIVKRDNEFTVGIAKMFLYPSGGPQKRTPRKYKEVILTGAERQKRFRERRESEGHRRVVSWENDEKLEPAYKTIKTKVHKSSVGLCKKERHLKEYLTACLKLAEEGSIHGYFPKEICSDLYEFYKTFGYEKPPNDAGV